MNFELPKLEYTSGEALKPQFNDLELLYGLIVDLGSFTVLEFGCGYSTIIIAEALRINKLRWEGLKKKPKVRNEKMFKVFCVETNDEWADEVYDKLPEELVNYVDITYSECHADIWEGQACHMYRNLPNVVPDFIYLDGPDPQQVEGSVNGISWKCTERTPMAADILLMESTLIPRTTILIDGRVNNFRFLKRNLKRNWVSMDSPEDDVALMYLHESRLGKINVIGRDVWTTELRKKE